MNLSEEKYLEALNKVHEDTESYDLIKSLISDHFTMIEHMQETSLYDVYTYEKRITKSIIEPMEILTFDNQNLKKEVNSLRRKLGLCNKYKIVKE